MKHLFIFTIILCALFFSSCKTNEADTEEGDKEEITDPVLSETLLAFGNECLILQSSDKGLSWEQANVPNSIKQYNGYTINIKDAIYAEGKWIAVGGFGSGAVHVGRILSSDDEGETWVSVENPSTSILYQIAYSEGLFVAVGDKNNILTSSDGNVWNKIAAEKFITKGVDDEIATFTHVAIGDGSIVVGGHIKFSFSTTTDSYIRVIESTDGAKTWVHGKGFSGKRVDGFIYADNEFIILDNGAVSTRKNGAWERDNRSGQSRFDRPVNYVNGHFVSSMTRNYTHIVGIRKNNQWIESVGSIPNLSINAIMGNKERYVMVGSKYPMSGGSSKTEASIYTSEDGLNWVSSRESLGEELIGKNCSFQTGIFAHDRFIISGEQTRMPGTPSVFYTSEDGLTWVKSAMPELSIEEQVYKIVSN